MNVANLLFFNKKGDQYNFQYNGTYWEGAVLFPVVSEKLFEIEHIFVIEKFLNLSSEVVYGFPHDGILIPNGTIWRTRWESNYDQQVDVSSIIYTYELGIDPELDEPVLVKATNVELYPNSALGDTIDPTTGISITSNVNSESMQINIALNSDNEGIYDRTLILENYTDPNNPITILKVSFHGEVEGEDSRLSVLLSNFGRAFNQEDSFIVRDVDIKEAYPDLETINQKRKELLLAGESIFPYIGSYKSLFNAIKFFGYYDLRVKEYWLNIKQDTADTLTPLQQNNQILNQLAKPNIQGESSLELISSLLKDENEGKFKQVEVYGKRSDGTFGLKKQYEEIFPSKSYKKTSLFGLFYDINRATEEEDAYQYPIVEDAFLFSPEEVLIKLFGLRERLKRDYLPLNARIIDITGEGVYFNIYKTRGWTDQLDIEEIKSGIEVDFQVFPSDGYVEDLRVFYTKQNLDGILYPNIDGTNTDISYYGNTTDPYTFFQEYPKDQLAPLITAIRSYYTDMDNGLMPRPLGDGDFDPPGYKLFSNGEEYVYPAGFPVLLIDKTFDLSWDETNAIWNALDPSITTNSFDVASYTSTSVDNPGYPLESLTSTDTYDIDTTLPQTVTFNIGSGNDWFLTNSPEYIFVRVESVDSPGNLVLGYVDSTGYNTVTGDLVVNIISVRGSGEYSNWKITPTNINFDPYTFEYYQNWVYANSFYSWDRLPYLDFYEIEWTIYKDDDARPYYFQMRGPLPEYDTLPHFLPYIGKYNVKCRVWDTLNSISLGIKRSVINVQGRSVELNTITRFRESEVYDWNNMPLTWESYPSQWIFPVENTDDLTQITSTIQEFAKYSNNLQEGQNCEVLTKISEVKAKTLFNLGIIKNDILTIESVLVDGGYSYAVVTTTSAHGYTTGDIVWIINSLGGAYGMFGINVLSSTTYEIPVIVTTPITGGYSMGQGNIKVVADGLEIANCNFQGDIESTASLVYSTINSSPLFPKYKIILLENATSPSGYKNFTIQAPNNTGDTWNNKVLTVTTTGSITTTTSSTSFTGGVNESEQYVYYDFETLPKKEMLYWGSKRLCWDTFEDFEFSKAYAHTWDMYDYHNDFLGGFSLYSLQYGDRIRVSQNTDGIVMEETDSPSNGYLDLYEAVDQLNSSTDVNIKRFDYTVRGDWDVINFATHTVGGSSPDLSTIPGPRNIKSSFNQIPIYTSFVYLPSGIAWDGDGEIWVTGENVVKFDGANYTTYNSTNSVLPSGTLNTNCIKIDYRDRKWIGIGNNLIPLVMIDDKDPANSVSYNITSFKDNSGASVCSNAASSVKVIEMNQQTGDIFISIASSTSANNGLLFYDGISKSWELYTTSNSGLSSNDIRDLKLEYYGLNKWYLWIATSSGLSRFDGKTFRTYTTGNSGLLSLNIYSIELDSLNHLWIGTRNSLSYWDKERWMTWDNTNYPSLNNGIISNIVDAGNGNIFFYVNNFSIIKGGGISLQSTILTFFDGYNFSQVDLYENDGVTQRRATRNLYGKSMLCAPWKTIKNGNTTYPKNIILPTSIGQICKVDYIIPHIHATSKFPGITGWDFVYHDTAYPYPNVKYMYNENVGEGQIGFNYLPSPLPIDLTLDSNYTRPVMPSVDGYSWSKPKWQRFSIDYLKNQFPSLNPDHIFLYAPLRDILSGKAAEEAYWRNPIVERIARKKSRDLFDNFEWATTIKGYSAVDENDGSLILASDYSGTVFLGSISNIPSQDIYVTGAGFYVAKYNKSGVIQWGANYGISTETISTRKYKVDHLGNIYILSRDTVTSVRTLYKIGPMGNLLTTKTIPADAATFQGTINGIEVDSRGNIYIYGWHGGTLTLGNFVLTRPVGSIYNGFIAKLDPSLSYIWAKDFDGQSVIEQVTSDGDDYIYVNGYLISSVNLGNGIVLTGSSFGEAFYSRFYSADGTCIWGKNPKTSAGGSSSSVSAIDSKGNISTIITSFGTLTIDGETFTNLFNDNLIAKFDSTGSLLWIKRIKDIIDTPALQIFDILTDSEDNTYFISIDNYTSPAKIFLAKINTEGYLVDIFSNSNDNYGAQTLTLTSYTNPPNISMDKENNLYVSVDFLSGKIPKERFVSGYSIGSVQSWLGSDSWSWKEVKFFENEFEIPLASTIFINPVDSLVPGKKDHIWTLTDTETGEVIVKIRKSPYFIWTFVKPGFYTVSCELQDANGNLYTVVHDGKVRVIDHKDPIAGDLVPEIVNPNDYLLRSIYYNKKDLGFPPATRYELNEVPPPPVPGML